MSFGQNLSIAKFASWTSAFALAVGLTGCGQIASVGDFLLYGFSERDQSVSPAVSCASEIAVTTTQVALVEDGDSTRTYSTTDPFYTDSDVDNTGKYAGGPWGFRSVETCVYLVNAFTGTVEIPISTNNTYSGRLDVKTSFPVAASGAWPGANQNLPTKLSFTGNGTTGHGATSRFCFVIARVDDAIQNPKNESPFTINLDAITSGDDNKVYTGKNACDISTTLEDDEGPGVRVSSISRIMEEPGGTGDSNAQFFVRLRTNPTANVTIPINDLYDATNALRREGTATPTSLTFTPGTCPGTGNWCTQQPVTVNSVDDLEVDGTKVYTVEVQAATSTDTDYNGFKPRNVVVINNDKSVPGYTWTRFDTSSGSSTGNVSGFATDEMNNMGSTYANFSIKLRSKPSANVTLNLSTSNATISNLLTTSLTFTPDNWNVDQTVYVNGKPDGADSNNQDYTISFTITSTDATYGGALAKPSFVIRSCDNDNTRLIQPCNFSGSPFGTSGSRLSAAEKLSPFNTTNIWLITKSSPGSAVTVGLSSTDTSEGTVPADVTIDSSNYNALGAGTNRITLTHVDDLLLDNTQNWTATTATSSGGLAYDPLDIFASTTDNEQKYYIQVTGVTKEDNTKTATISICLGAHNTNQVQITAACSGDECGSIDAPNPVTFPIGTTIQAATPSNSACASDANRRDFVVRGANDAFADGTQTFSVTFSLDANGDPIYGSGAPGSQTVSNEDDELPGKAVFVSTASYQGEMTLAGVGGADNFCNTTKPAYAPTGTYKALIISDGTTKRIATTDGSTSAGQTGWVLTANYYYYRCSASGAASCSDESTRLFIATSAALIPFPMSRDFSTGGNNEFWTGMNGNMTAATQSNTPAKVLDDPDYRDNCAGWTYLSAPNSPFPGYFGQTWVEVGGGGGNITSTTNVACSSTRKLICVQQ